MKKKNIIVAVVIIVIIAAGFFGKAVFDEVKAQMEVVEALTQILDENVKKENIDYGGMGKYEDSVKEVAESFEKLNTDLKNLENEGNNKKYDNFLESKYLKDPAAGKKNIQELSKVMSNYEELLNNDLKQLSGSLEKMPMSKKDKEELRETNKTEIEKVSKEIASTTTYLKELFAKNEALFDFLIQRKGKYSVKGDQVYFDSQKDVNDYNKFIDDLIKYTESK